MIIPALNISITSGHFISTPRKSNPWQQRSHEFKLYKNNNFQYWLTLSERFNCIFNIEYLAELLLWIALLFEGDRFIGLIIQRR